MESTRAETNKSGGAAGLPLRCALQTQVGSRVMTEKCHKQTSARAQWHRLFGWNRPGDGSSAIDEDLRDRTQRPILQPHDRNWLGLNWKFNRQNFERPILPAQPHNRPGQPPDQAARDNQLQAQMY